MNEEQDLRDLWQSQDVPRAEIDVHALSARARQFQTSIRTRNFVEILAALLVAPVFIRTALGTAPLMARIGAALLVAGLGVIVAHIHRHGRSAAEKPPLDGPTQRLVDWHRAELERQRRLVRAVPRWYVGPMVPGMLLFVGGFASEHPHPWLFNAFVYGVCAVVLLAVLWANRVTARHLERQLAELDG